jgi:hypothetical protein|tara:strand:+ start:806 stop:931 length:126 start_codon:yes stop_codon:yes gene_type:complete
VLRNYRYQPQARFRFTVIDVSLGVGMVGGVKAVILLLVVVQ